MVNRILAEILNRLKKPDVKKIILFGSVARKEADRFSDLDIIIIKDTDKRFIKRLLEIESLVDLPVSVDIFVYTPSEFYTMLEMGNPFIENVVKEGKVVYEAQS